MHLQVATKFYFKYRNEESENKALRELIKEEGVAEVTAVEEKTMNMNRSETLKHCFGGEETHETTRMRKTPRWLYCTFKDRRRNYMKQQLVKDTFAINRYGKELLVQKKKEEKVYKIITNKEFTKEEDSPFVRLEPHKNFNIQWGTVYSGDLAEKGDNGNVEMLWTSVCLGGKTTKGLWDS